MKHLGSLDKNQETKVSAVSTACCALYLHCTTGCICNPNLWWIDRFILPAGDLEVFLTSSLANYRFPFRKWRILSSFYKWQNLHFVSFHFVFAYYSNPPLWISSKKEKKKMLQQRVNHDIKKLRQGCMLTPECSRSCASIQNFKVWQFALTLLSSALQCIPRA